MAEIKDLESARAWLVEAPRKAQIVLAARSTVRALKGLAAEASALNEAALPAFRASLICSVSGTGADSELLRSAAKHALATLRDIHLKEPRALAALAATRSALSAVMRLRVSYNSAGILVATGDEAAADAIAASADVSPETAWTEAATDAKLLETGQSTTVLDSVVYGEMRNAASRAGHAEGDQSFLGFFSSDHAVWNFWKRWYEGMTAGRPLDWDLQREVALIPDDDWKKGPEHIARLIEEIEARFELKARIRELEDELASASRDRFGIGGNNPPEAIESAPSIAKEFAIIWAPLQDLKLEVERKDREPSRIAKLLALLAEALLHGLRWCASKADLIVDTSIKWAVPVVGGTVVGGSGYLALNPDKLAAVIEAGKHWLSMP